MTASRLKVAILSFAHGHAAGYARILSEREDVELLLADPDRHGSPDQADRGPQVAERVGARYVDSYDKAFSWEPQAVVICSENTRHRDLVLRAAAAGAHILCEKPLAITAPHAAEMAAAAQAAGVALMIAHPVRFSPYVAALRARIAAGELGEVLSIVATNNGKLPADRAWFTDPLLSGGGCLVDHVVHCADLIDALLGESASTVRAVTNRLLRADVNPIVETGGMVDIAYPSGVVATIDCSWSHPDSAPDWGGLTLEVVGTRGAITIDPFAAHVGGYGRDGAEWFPFGSDLDADMIDEFIEVARRRRQPQSDGASAVRTVAIVAAAQQSAREGRVVAVQLR